MLYTVNNRAELFAEMASGSTLITPNNRLSNQLLRDYIKTTQHQVIDKPHCLPYTTFLHNAYTNIHYQYAEKHHPTLLNSNQERCLWEQILNKQSQYPCTASLLQEIQKAWTNCTVWSIDVTSDLFYQTPQTQQFQTWHREFQNALNTHDAITDAQIVDYLLKHPRSIPNNQIIWVAFDDFTPQQRQLQTTLESYGSLQFFYDIEQRGDSPLLYGANDTQDELSQLVIWLKAQLIAKTPRIAVIVPDLIEQSESLQRRLRRDIPEEKFELSFGKALSDYPLVAHALHWLTLDKHILTNHQVQLLLNSPYLGGALSEVAARSKLLEESKLLQETNIPYTHLLTMLQQKTPKLFTLLEKLSDYPTEATPSEWISHFKARLMTLDFPGEYALNSSSYQYLQRLQSLFDDFLHISLIQPRMTQTQALSTFRDIARSTIFQVRKDPSPIQVSGLLEASGCEFDAVWVTGLTDQCLPQKVKLSPFIPMSIQREHQMPHALLDKELLLAKQLLNRVHNGSLQCVFSYPRFIGDSPQLPSPLVQDLPTYSSCNSEESRPTSPLMLHTEQYLWPINPNDKTTGGTSLLANQAKCPFRAFAIHRLHTKANLVHSTGLNQAERGQIVHKILEIIWKQLSTQYELLTLSSIDLSRIINQAILLALEPVIPTRPSSFPPFIQAIEHQRLHRLIMACLTWEKQRAPFTVKAIEQAFNLNLANIDFQVRVDRLDTVNDNETWVIDYKSSIPPHKPWNEERPEAPQLLLYALLDPTITALLFLELKAGQITCSGLSQDKHPLSGLSSIKKEETWSEKRSEWINRLTTLATEFSEGYCPPKPQRRSTCATCEFTNLCRI